MTSVAWDGRTLAADSRVTRDGVIVNERALKIHDLRPLKAKYLSDTLLYGAFSGTMIDVPKVLAYIGSGAFPKENIEHGCYGVIVGKKYVYTMEANTGYLVQNVRDHYLSVGSGKDFVLSALGLGLSAKEAVAHACQFDIYSGGEVKSVDVDYE